VANILATGVVGMDAAHAEALSAFREFNYERIYLRDESVAQGRAVVSVLRALVEHFAAHPDDVAIRSAALGASDEDPTFAAVRYVSGMTDRFAFRTAVSVLGWPSDRLPQGIDR
jgi:dGTPase